MDYIQNNQKMLKPNPPGPIVEFMVRYIPFVGYVLIGLIGKFGYDIVSKKKI